MNEIIVYILDTNKFDKSSLENFVSLNDDDLLLLSKYKNEISYKEHLASLYLKRRFVGDFYIGKNEKPLAKHAYFNVSHSHGTIVLAISKTSDVGIDIELIRDVKNELKRYVSNNKEYQHIENNEDFFKVWTGKESLLKCVGIGLKELKNVPAFPLDGQKQYLGNTYSSKAIRYGEYCASITCKGEDFTYKLINI